MFIFPLDMLFNFKLNHIGLEGCETIWLCYVQTTKAQTSSLVSAFAIRYLKNIVVHARIQRKGGRAMGPDPPPPPLKNHKNIGFLSNTGPDPLKITKLPSQHSMLGNL